MKIIASALVVFTAGIGVFCAYSSPMNLQPRLYIEDAFTPAERATILSAADAWHDASSSVEFHPTDDSSGDDLVYVERADCGADIGGYTSQGYYREVVCLNLPWTEGWLRPLTEHELGHALGLQHVTDHNAIMNPLGDVDDITCVDVEQLNARWGLDGGECR